MDSISWYFVRLTSDLGMNWEPFTKVRYGLKNGVGHHI